MDKERVNGRRNQIINKPDLTRTRERLDRERERERERE